MISLIDLRLRYRLSPSEARILKLLLERKLVTATIVDQELHLTSSIKVMVHRIRRTLDSLPITIHSRKNLGYWIEPADKEFLMKHLADKIPIGHRDTEEPLASQPAEVTSSGNDQ